MAENRVIADGAAEATRAELLTALEHVFFAILRVDPARDDVLILQSRDRPDLVAQHHSWSEYLASYADVLTGPGRETLNRRMTNESLLAADCGAEGMFSFDAAYQRDGRTNWVKVTVKLQDEDGVRSAYVFVRQTNEEHLRKSIIDLYVYNTCDYFIYLDARNNSYRMFSGSDSGTPLPPVECDDYDTALVEYARSFVVPEDQEMVIREMRIGRVLEQLERHGVHSFYCGVRDPVRGYTRKQLTYRYYDRDTQMILLSRTDVTGVYLEERARQRELQVARLEAQTDTMTGLLNYRGAVEQVGEALAAGGRAALLFIDLDNFKQVNDTLGHLEGDRLLQRVAQVLRMQTRENDLLCRVGGDEFIVFLRGVTEKAQAADCAGRICEAIRRIPLPENGIPAISCSIGAAFAPEDGCDYHTLVRTADKLAYRAKAAGKDRVLV